MLYMKGERGVSLNWEKCFEAIGRTAERGKMEFVSDVLVGQATPLRPSHDPFVWD